jgi:hypothetical protein
LKPQFSSLSLFFFPAQNRCFLRSSFFFFFPIPKVVATSSLLLFLFFLY